MHLTKIETIVGTSSRENTYFLLHSIIHRFYLTFEKQFIIGLEDLSIEGRKKFETYLISKCINPMVQSKDESICRTREQTDLHPECRFWGRRVEERFRSKTDELKDFEENYLPNVFLPFRAVTLSEFRHFVSQDPLNEFKYPILWGILETIDMPNGFSIFALKYLPSMIQWMKFIHSHFNNRLTQEQVEKKPREFSVKYALQRRKENNWDDEVKWNKAWQGFVEGWNHVVSCVTSDRTKKGQKIANTKSDKDNNNDEKKENAGNNEDEKEQSTTGPMDLGLGDFRNYLVIEDALNQYEVVPFPKIVGTGPSGEIQPEDVPLWTAMECGTGGSLPTSKMIRLILDHLVTINNSCLMKCHQLRSLNDDEEAVEANAIGNIMITHISSEKDVVELDENRFLQEIQQCTTQKLEYGNNKPFNFNLMLLESRLKGNYITGRKFITFSLNELFFELAGQYDIRQVIAQIEDKYEKIEKKNYFHPLTEEILQNLKNKIEKHAEFSTSRTQESIDTIEKDYKQATKKKMLVAYKTAKQSVEQVLIWLNRQKSIPDGGSLIISSYMKDFLHLQQDEYGPFTRTNELCLRHCDGVWKFLERMHMLTENIWHCMPETLMDLYKLSLFFFSLVKYNLQIFFYIFRVPVPDNLKTILRSIVTGNESTLIWELLMKWKKLLECVLSQTDYRNASKIALKHYLTEATCEKSYDLVASLPNELMLVHAGHSFVYCAEVFQEQHSIK
ncbi:hypothetical protein RFI_38116 [Reticulomyxa filosa]|uniref:Uncharacterized protein n=1 Tax=Reticulomyxa filosa TaxID=46433 RepID=X6LE54_RETFI|nr:hypothetical protein RFI_38116 [Reticulomyxa filosa]|eukprot:ETN99366.1 hypothetical protein RFI_38116 [Reticulomyxa filosa]